MILTPRNTQRGAKVLTEAMAQIVTQVRVKKYLEEMLLEYLKSLIYFSLHHEK